MFDVADVGRLMFFNPALIKKPNSSEFMRADAGLSGLFPSLPKLKPFSVSNLHNFLRVTWKPR
jgi:hypothetical protein